MRKIDAFAHILPSRYLERLDGHLERAVSSDQLRYYREGVFEFDPSISDLDARWRKVERFGDYAQVLVLAVPPLEEVGPPTVAADLARLANDEMAALVAKHPDRFVGFAAALPLSDVQASLIETDRAVDELGALGVQIFTNVQGRPLDDPAFEPLFARLESLDCTIWLHPTRNRTWADYRLEAQSDYGLWWSIGWPYETAAALGRLVYSGLMERHPRLKVIAHHGGGMVAHFSARLGMGPGYRQVKDTLARPPLEYFKMFHADTALFGAPHAVRCMLDFFGPSNVLFGTDMPLGPPDAVEATIADLEAAPLSDREKSAVYAGNARRLFGIREE
ncbi:MAG TPA: amidohydrolase family protein [Candidatus Limnocylindrales bacterium]|nr:amidohydrolase family protein [Candidatus Limnocylindrales bacterium]